jgi:hypothetical protein
MRIFVPGGTTFAVGDRMGLIADAFRLVVNRMVQFEAR